MTREEAIKIAQEEYERLRNAELNALKRREDEAVSKDGEIRTLLNERAALPMRALRLAMNNPEGAKAVSEKMREEGLKINAEIRARLSRAGFPENHLQIHYACPVCKDTGYTSDMPPVMCDCFTKRIHILQRDAHIVSDFGSQNFDKYDESKIPDEVVYGEITQRQLTGRIRDLCLEYANGFPNTYKPNLLLTGEAGLGKTFLLSAIAERIESRGFSPVLISAYRLLEIMREKHFHMDAPGTDFESLLACPILLIDDLGCEPMLKNITQEYLFVLINERTQKKKPTVIATNMTPVQLKDRYGERIMSRICDTSVCDSVRLMGRDLRRL
ncbi:MAG: ATP-binding protein [Clostridia bacterium]|nr:ATP-binding protein [Clostridia bacterium]